MIRKAGYFNVKDATVKKNCETWRDVFRFASEWYSRPQITQGPRVSMEEAGHVSEGYQMGWLMWPVRSSRFQTTRLRKYSAQHGTVATKSVPSDAGNIIASVVENNWDSSREWNIYTEADLIDGDLNKRDIISHDTTSSGMVSTKFFSACRLTWMWNCY